MKSSTTLSLFLTLCVAFSCDRTKDDATIYTSTFLKGLTFRLEHGTFKFKYERDSTIDSTVGTVKKLNDTLFLTYDKKLTDQGAKKGRKIGGFVSVSDIFSGHHFSMRPPKLLIRGRKLLYLDLISNKPLTFEEGDSVTEVFLERLK